MLRATTHGRMLATTMTGTKPRVDASDLEESDSEEEDRCVFTHELFYDNVVDSVDDAERAARIARFKQAAKEKKRKREA